MPAEMPKSSNITYLFESDTRPIFQQSNLPEEFLPEGDKRFLEIDSKIQGAYLHALVLEKDYRAIPEEKLDELKRGEFERRFLHFVAETGISHDYEKIIEIGPYDENGTDIIAHRKRFLESGIVPTETVVEFPPIDTKVQLATIVQAIAD